MNLKTINISLTYEDVNEQNVLDLQRLVGFLKEEKSATNVKVKVKEETSLKQVEEVATVTTKETSPEPSQEVKEEKKAPKAKKATKAKAEKKEEKAEKPTLEEVRKQLMELYGQKGKDVAKEVLDFLGATKLAEIKEEDYSKALVEIAKALKS